MQTLRKRAAYNGTIGPRHLIGKSHVVQDAWSLQQSREGFMNPNKGSVAERSMRG